jgi:5-methylcytosine-specific restriction endonuclease McrA
MLKQHVAVYGNKKLVRIYCPDCDCWTLVLKGIKLCCDEESDAMPDKFKVMISAARIRKKPGRKAKKNLLEQFNYSCVYCERRFDTFVEMAGKMHRIRLNWDHQIPFSYSYNNNSENFLPACNFCNGWKSNRIFQTIDEVKVYVNQKWEKQTKKNQLPVLRQTV